MSKQLEEKSLQKYTVALNVWVNELNFEPPSPSQKMVKLENYVERIIIKVRACLFESEGFKIYMRQLLNNLINLISHKIRRTLKTSSIDTQSLALYDISFLANNISNVLKDELVFEKEKCLVYFNKMIKEYCK